MQPNSKTTFLKVAAGLGVAAFLSMAAAPGEPAPAQAPVQSPAPASSPAGVSAQAQAPMQAPAHAYAAGQVWTYHTRPADEGSLLKIDEIEQKPGTPAETIYHLSVIGLHLAGSATPTAISHLPVSQASLDSSVIALSKSTVPFPDYTYGEKQWRQNEGGVFVTPIAHVVEVADRNARHPGAH